MSTRMSRRRATCVRPCLNVLPDGPISFRGRLRIPQRPPCLVHVDRGIDTSVFLRPSSIRAFLSRAGMTASQTLVVSRHWPIGTWVPLGGGESQTLWNQPLPPGQVDALEAMTLPSTVARQADFASSAPSTFWSPLAIQGRSSHTASAAPIPSSQQLTGPKPVPDSK